MSRSPRVATSSVKWVSANEDKNGKRTLAVHDIQSHMRDSKSQLNIISIFGKAREGKSFLMNCLAGESNIFRVSNESESCTQGIDISNKIIDLIDFSVLDSGISVTNPNKMKIMFVDAEGQGDRNTTYDAKLVCPILLISKCVILNWLGGFQKNDILNQLAIMSKAASNVHNETSAASGEKKFGNLHIVFRDWHYDGPNSNAEAIRRALLSDEPDNEDSRDRNKIRKDIQAAFQTISVHLLDPPTEKTIDSRGILTLEKCTSDFKRQVRDLRHKLSVQLRDPTMFIGMRQPLNGTSMCNLVRIITESLNEKNIILPQSAYVSMLSMEIDSKRQQLVDEMEIKVNTFISDLENGKWDVSSKVSKAIFLVSLEDILNKIEKELAEQQNSYQREMTFLLGKLSEDATMKPRLQAIAKSIGASHTSMVNKFKSAYNHVFTSRMRKNSAIIENDLENELKSFEASLHNYDHENSVNDALNQFLTKSLMKLTNDNAVKHDEVDMLQDNIKKIFMLRKQNIIRIFHDKVKNEKKKKECYEKLDLFKNKLEAEITEQCKVCCRSNSNGFSFKLFGEQLNTKFYDLNEALKKQLGGITMTLKDEIEANFYQAAKEKLGFARNVYNETVIEALQNYLVQHIKREIDLKYMDKETLLRQLAAEGYDMEKEFGKKEPFSGLLNNVLNDANRKLRSQYTSKWSDLDNTIYENRVVSQLPAILRDIHLPAVKDMKVIYVETKREEEKLIREQEAREIKLKKAEIEEQKQLLLRKEQELDKERLRYQQEMDAIASMKEKLYQERLDAAELRHDSMHSEDMDIDADTAPSKGKKKSNSQKNTVLSEKQQREKDIQEQRQRAKEYRDNVLRDNKTGAKSRKSKMEVSENSDDDVVVEPVSKRHRVSTDRKEPMVEESSEIAPKTESGKNGSRQSRSSTDADTGKGKKRLISEVAATAAPTSGGAKSSQKSTSKAADAKTRGMTESTRDQILREQREQEEKMIAARLGKK